MSRKENNNISEDPLKTISSSGQPVVEPMSIPIPPPINSPYYDLWKIFNDIVQANPPMNYLWYRAKAQEGIDSISKK